MLFRSGADCVVDVCFRAKWLKEPNAEAEELFRMVAEVFIFWAKSHVSQADRTPSGKEDQGTSEEWGSDRIHWMKVLKCSV